MHQIAFDLKRGHLRTVAYGEKAMQGVGGMTAARFDLLCMIRQQQILEGGDMLTTGVLQRELWSRLDLDKSTVSKMLCRLEEMGWVRRARSSSPGDWRTKKVVLTSLGLERIAKAMRVMFRQRTMLKYFERIFKAGTWGSKHVMQNVFDVSEAIQYVASCFGDRSIGCYEHGAQLADGIRCFLDRSYRRPFHHLYEPCPTPRMPSAPRKGPRLPRRPFEFTAYENAIRDYLWGDEKRRRTRGAH